MIKITKLTCCLIIIMVLAGCAKVEQDIRKSKSEDNEVSVSETQKEELSEERAMEIATEIIGMKNQYNNKGYCCTTISSNLTEEERQKIISQLDEPLQRLSFDILESTCCNSSAAAINHAKSRIDEDRIHELHAEYEGKLYFFEGAAGKGGSSLIHIFLTDYEESKITGTVNLYTVAGVTTQKFTIVKEDEYKLINLEDIETAVNFVDTYKDIILGAEKSEQYTACFHSNGTLLAMNKESKEFIEGEYTFTRDELEVSIGTHKKETFIQTGKDFKSYKKYKTDKGEEYCTIEDTVGKEFIKCFNATQKESPKIEIQLDWEDAQVELSLSADAQGAVWKNGKLYDAQGNVIATEIREGTTKTINIYDIDQVYTCAVDDEKFAEHSGNLVSSGNLTIKKYNKIIEKEIGKFMLRHPTGYWNAAFVIEDGEIQLGF